MSHLIWEKSCFERKPCERCWRKKVYEGEERRSATAETSVPLSPTLPHSAPSVVLQRDKACLPLLTSPALTCAPVASGWKREYASYIHYHFTGRRMQLCVHTALRNRWVSSPILPKRSSVILRRFYFLVELFICYPQFKSHSAIWSNLECSLHLDVWTVGGRILTTDLLVVVDLFYQMNNTYCAGSVYKYCTVDCMYKLL